MIQTLFALTAVWLISLLTCVLGTLGAVRGPRVLWAAFIIAAAPFGAVLWVYLKVKSHGY